MGGYFPFQGIFFRLGKVSQATDYELSCLVLIVLIRDFLDKRSLHKNNLIKLRIYKESFYYCLKIIILLFNDEALT